MTIPRQRPADDVPAGCVCHAVDSGNGDGTSRRPDVVTCGHCYRTWCDHCTPTPAARCPFESDHVYPEVAGPTDAERLTRARRKLKRWERNLAKNLAHYETCTGYRGEIRSARAQLDLVREMLDIVGRN